MGLEFLRHQKSNVYFFSLHSAGGKCQNFEFYPKMANRGLQRGGWVMCYLDFIFEVQTITPPPKKNGSCHGEHTALLWPTVLAVYLSKYFFCPPCKPFLPTFPTLYIYGKTWMHMTSDKCSWSLGRSTYCRRSRTFFSPKKLACHRIIN